MNIKTSVDQRLLDSIAVTISKNVPLSAPEIKRLIEKVDSIDDAIFIIQISSRLNISIEKASEVLNVD